MSFTEDLLNGLGEHLAPKITGAAFRESGAYFDDEWGLYAQTAPLNRRCIVMRAYWSADDPSLSDSVVSVQLEFRGGVLEVTRALDEASDALVGFWGGTLGSVKVQFVTRRAGAELSQDGAGNYRYTDNYDLAVHRPSAHRQ